MNKEDLYRSFNNIDDDILERSEVTKINSMYAWKKWGVIAACLSLLVIGVINISHNWGNIGNHDEPLVIHLVDSVVEKNAGILTYHTDNFSEYTMEFTLEKKNDEEMYILFNGYNILKEWTDEDGTHYEVAEYLIISPYSDFEEQANRTIINDALEITVDGIKVNELPKEAGTYEVSIYYGELYNRLDVVDTDVEILGFGHFMINCEEFEKNNPLTE